MLILKQLTLENFGPFKGRQVLTFPESGGVAVVYGENMRGKTSLLNAIRFAFFGKVLGRNSRQAVLSRLANWESTAEGIFGFMVTLEFNHGGDSLVLSRGLQVREGVAKPSLEEDYKSVLQVKKNSEVLGPQQAIAEIVRILPEQISRFFLFDGELLQEYEELLQSESDAGKHISDAIEKILGVPVLIKSRAVLSSLREEAATQEARAASNNQQTAEIGASMSQVQEEKRELTKYLDKVRLEADELRAKKLVLEVLLKQREQYAILLEKKDSAAKDIEKLREKRIGLLDRLRLAMADAWRPMLNERASVAFGTISNRMRELHRNLVQIELLEQFSDSSSHPCPICAQVVSPKLASDILSRGPDVDVSKITFSTELSKLTRQLDAVSKTRMDSAFLKDLWKQKQDLELELVHFSMTLAEINRKCEAFDEEPIRLAKADFETTVRQLESHETLVRSTEADLQTKKEAYDRLEDKLDRIASPDMNAERVRRDVYDKLHKVFDAAVSKYRERLRQRVQDDATELFRKMISDPDYTALKINQNYGLTIVHRDGADVPVRSAGAEHVVALCLLGALQKNAPLRGPIIIDSPFGRLDTAHATNVVRALPSMAPQVLLLVYESEMPKGVARAELKDSLKSEWKFERRSARHTEIVAYKDVE